jgi:hypothetical protein
MEIMELCKVFFADRDGKRTLSPKAEEGEYIAGPGLHR